MTRGVRLFWGAAMLLVLAATVSAQKVETDYDHHANFSQYKTFMWLREPHLSNPLMAKRLQDDVNNALTAKGWQLVSDNADVGIVANGATREQQTLDTFYTGFPGWRWRYWGEPPAVYVTTYTVGTLVVDMFDGHTKQVVFRGTASDTLSDKPEKNEHKLEESVDKMFKKFPPGAKEGH